MSSNFVNIMEPDLELLLIDKHDGWSTIYQHICAEAQKRFELSFSDSRRSEFRTRNRYKDISPYDHSRIRLKRNNIDYINASRVEVPQVGRAYILTQGPLLQIVDHFWLMIWEKKSPAILMLNRLVEKDQPKCHRYFPTGGEGDDHLVFGDVGLKVSFVEEREKTSHFVARLLRVEDELSGETHDLHHFHYLLWPDFGVPPSPDSFLEFLFSVRGSGVLDDPERPPVVHCSAGVGRSGVFCIIDVCLKMAEMKGTAEGVDLRATLIEMRRYRMGLIQTPQQLRFSYVALVEALKMLNLSGGERADAIRLDVEEDFVSKNFATTPTGEFDDDDDVDVDKNFNSSNSFEHPEVILRASRGSIEKKGRKRCSFGRVMPHLASVDDPESVWLINNTIITGEPLIRPGAAEACPGPPHQTSVDKLPMEEVDEGGYFGDHDGSGVDDEGDEVESDDEDEEDDETCECLEGHGCSPRLHLRRRKPQERTKKSWEEVEMMMKSQAECEAMNERQRRRWKVKVVGCSVVFVLLAIVVYRATL